MKYLIDVNVPDAVFQGEQFSFVKNLDPEWSDRQIWEYAIQHDFVIVTKDTDFFHWSMAFTSPPKVVHLKVGNMRLKVFFTWIDKNWSQIETLIAKHQLVIAYPDKLEIVR
jgi:predicted nuclease of predicted toxin-antitoxin system